MTRIQVYRYNGQFCAHRSIPDKNRMWYIAKPFIVDAADHEKLEKALSDLCIVEPTEVANKDTAANLANEVAKSLGLRTHSSLYKKASLFSFDVNKEITSLTLHKPASACKGFEEDEKLEFQTLSAAVASIPI